MKVLSKALSIDLTSSASDSFFVVVISLDQGDLYLSEGFKQVGSDPVIGAIKTAGLSSISVEKEALPSIYLETTWINREVIIYECVEGSGSVINGAIAFKGIISKEPSEMDEVLALSFIVPKQKIVTLPNYGIVESSEFPNSPDESQGKYKPQIIGTVENCPLIPVAQPTNTVLSAGAFIGSKSLNLSDTTGFTDAGTVWVGGEIIAYTSKSDTELFGVTIKKDHVSGTIISQVGSWDYLAAGHSVTDISKVKVDGAISTEGSIDLINSLVSFPVPPTVPRESEIFNQQIHFDEVDSNVEILYNIEYNVIGQDSNGVPTYADLSSYIRPPSNVIPGSMSFDIEWEAQTDLGFVNDPETLVIYLAGTPFAIDKDGGSGTLNVTTTNTNPLVLTHFVGAGTPATVPRVTSVRATWASSSNTSQALNPLNAIKGATGTFVQNPNIFPGTVYVGDTSFVVFPSPSIDRVILGNYTATFSVDTSGYIGEIRATIAGKLVYVADNGVVLFTDTNFDYDEDTDQIPIAISGGGSITVTGLTRTVITGNLDDANYATLKHPNNTTFRAMQTTVNPNRGRITKVSAVVEWFSTDAWVGEADVFFSGIKIGSLAQQGVEGQTFDRTVSIDSVTQGTAQLLSSDITKSYSGGTASLQNVITAMNESVQVNYQYVGNINPLQGYEFEVSVSVYAPEKVASNGNTFTYSWMGGTTGGGNWFSVGGVSISPTGSAGTATANLPSMSSGQLVTIEGIVFVSATDVSHAQSLVYLFAKMLSITFNWSLNAIIQNNTATFQNIAQSNRTLNHSGTAVSLSGGNINITTPAPARTSVNTFPIPWITDWNSLTNQVIEVQWANGSAAANIALVQTYISVEFEKATASIPLEVTATVIGSSSNPADVLSLLALELGETLDISGKLRLKTWATANSFTFNRRIAEIVDGLTLFTFASQQAGVFLAKRNTTIFPTRWLDVSEESTFIEDSILLSPASFSWVDQLDNDITVKYLKDYSTQAYSKTLRAYSGNNNICSQSVRDIKETIITEIQAGWVTDLTTAQLLLDTYVTLYAKLRKKVSLSLPYAYSYIEEGDMLDYNNIAWKVVSISRPSGFITISAVEIPL